MALEPRSLEDDIGDGETLVKVWRTGQLQSDCTQTWTRSAHSLETSIADPPENFVEQIMLDCEVRIVIESRILKRKHES